MLTVQQFTCFQQYTLELSFMMTWLQQYVKIQPIEYFILQEFIQSLKHNQKYIFLGIANKMSKSQNDIENEIRKKMIQAQLQKSLQIRRKIVSKQLDKIQTMPLSQLIQRQRRPKPVTPTDHTKAYFQNQLNKSLTEAGFESTVENPAERHAQIFKQAEQKIKEYRRQLKKNPIMAQVRKGKLGVDTIFIAFGLMGFILLPMYFIKKLKSNQSKIVQNRGVDPRVIQNLDEDSPISIDSVSEQSIHYLNSQRQAQIKQKLKKQNKISQLRRELDL